MSCRSRRVGCCHALLAARRPALVRHPGATVSAVLWLASQRAEPILHRQNRCSAHAPVACALSVGSFSPGEKARRGKSRLFCRRVNASAVSTRAKIGAINAIVDLDWNWSDTNDAPIEVWKSANCTGPAGAVRRSKVEAASRATASRPALGTATISRGRRMRRQHSASCRCGEPPRSIGISARPWATQRTPMSHPMARGSRPCRHGRAGLHTLRETRYLRRSATAT